MDALNDFRNDATPPPCGGNDATPGIPGTLSHTDCRNHFAGRVVDPDSPIHVQVSHPDTQGIIDAFDRLQQMQPCTNWHEKALKQSIQLRMLHLAIARRNHRLKCARERYETLRSAAAATVEAWAGDSPEDFSAAIDALSEALNPPRTLHIKEQGDE